MYPFIRMFWQVWKYRKAAPLSVFGTHVSRHVCLPWDIDMWMELNNGRTLTLYDLGRIPMAYRVGLVEVLRRKRWGLTMAGASVRYRRRVKAFETVDMRSRLASWDERFFYIEQSMWVKGKPCSSAILRTGVTKGGRVIDTSKVLAALGQSDWELPPTGYVAEWIESDAERPWPPQD